MLIVLKARIDISSATLLHPRVSRDNLRALFHAKEAPFHHSKVYRNPRSWDGNHALSGRILTACLRHVRLHPNRTCQDTEPAVPEGKERYSRSERATSTMYTSIARLGSSKPVKARKQNYFIQIRQSSQKTTEDKSRRFGQFTAGLLQALNFIL